MNMHLTELQRQHLAHKQRQERMNEAAQKFAESKRQKPRLVYVNPITPAPALRRLKAPLSHHLSSRVRPEWSYKAILFDAHVRRWREETGSARASVKDYIRRRSVELGSDYETVVGPKRDREIVRVRQLIMWEIKEMRGEKISYPEIGRFFGSRDHTTVLHAVRKVEAMKAAER